MGWLAAHFPPPLLCRVDLMIIGGGMAFTFKKTLENMKIGNSLFDEDGAKIVDEIMKEAKAKNVEMLLPVDFVCGDKFAPDANTQICDDKTGVPDGWMGLDVGPKTVELARAVSWNHRARQHSNKSACGCLSPVRGCSRGDRSCLHFSHAAAETYYSEKLGEIPSIPVLSSFCFR